MRSAPVPRASAVLVSESWRHRIIAITPDGSRRTVLDNLPVYPSRLSPAASGGFWLTAFTARTQLVEFVLRESAYRRRMMNEIDPEYWIAPKLKSGQSFLEPMQGAHIKTMGVVKPWAPPRSYGLVIRLNADGLPLYALHSRVDGINHGIVAAVEMDGSLYALAKGPGRLLRMPSTVIEQELPRMNDIVLALRNATKLYAGVAAIENVDFELRRGEIHALVGENGAGKSTLDQGDGRRRHAEFRNDAGRTASMRRRGRRSKRAISASRWCSRRTAWFRP